MEVEWVLGADPAEHEAHGNAHGAWVKTGRPFSTASDGSRHTLLDKQLAVVIEDRKQTAHGPWAWQLNAKQTDYTRRSRPPLNFVAIKARSDLILQ